MEKIKRYLETNENKHTTTQNLRETAKAFLREKIIAFQAHVKKQENFQINNLTLHIKGIEKKQ